MICVRGYIAVQKREGKMARVGERMIMTFDGLTLAKVLTRIVIFVKRTRVDAMIVDEEDNI